MLAAADLRDISSHGVARLHTYFDMFELGRINPKPKVSVVRETPSTATVDGDNGLGLVVGPKANRIAMDKALASGSGWVSVRHTNHFGIAGYYVLQALQARSDRLGHDQLDQAGGASVGRRTAPGYQSHRHRVFPPSKSVRSSSIWPPTAAAYGKVEMARRKGEQLPEGWAIDAQGQPTRIPTRWCRAEPCCRSARRASAAATRLLSGDHGRCAQLCAERRQLGTFCAAVCLRQEIPERSVGKGIGHFFGALRIDGFIDADEFKRQIDDYVQTMRATKPAPGTDGPLVPGDPEADAEAIRRVVGIPLILPVVEELRDISRKTNIAFD